MNDGPELFEPQLSLQDCHTRNSRFNLSPVSLDVGRNFTIFQGIKYLTMLLKRITKGLHQRVTEVCFWLE